MYKLIIVLFLLCNLTCSLCFDYSNNEGEFNVGIDHTLRTIQCSGRSVRVPVALVAELQHNPGRRTTRTKFDRAVFYRRMRELDARPGDQRGHLIASSLGGPAEIWNLAPQTACLNANQCSR